MSGWRALPGRRQPLTEQESHGIETQDCSLFIPAARFRLCDHWLVYPMGHSLWISLHDWKINPDQISPFVGLGNYIDAFTNSQFWRALKNTCMFALVTTVGQLILGVLVALLLNRISRGKGLFSSSLFSAGGDILGGGFADFSISVQFQPGWDGQLSACEQSEGFAWSGRVVEQCRNRLGGDIQPGNLEGCRFCHGDPAGGSTDLAGGNLFGRRDRRRQRMAVIALYYPAAAPAHHHSGDGDAYHRCLPGVHPDRADHQRGPLHRTEVVLSYMYNLAFRDLHYGYASRYLISWPPLYS